MEILDGNAATVRQLMRKLDGKIKTEGEGSLRVAFTGEVRDDTASFLRRSLARDFEFLSLDPRHD